jgi:hypothetical protein
MLQLQKWVLHLAKVDTGQASHRLAQTISEDTRQITLYEIPVSLNNAHTHTHTHTHTHAYTLPPCCRTVVIITVNSWGNYLNPVHLVLICNTEWLTAQTPLLPLTDNTKVSTWQPRLQTLNWIKSSWIKLSPTHKDDTQADPLVWHRIPVRISQTAWVKWS